MRSQYNRDRQDFYKRATPIIAALILILAIVLEVLYRALKYGQLAAATSVINWISFAIFIGLTFAVRRWVFSSWLICPLLTLLSYYYFIFVDYQLTTSVVYFT
jgi:hypothetical protein